MSADATPAASLDRLDTFCQASLVGAGADVQTAQAATRALMHATSLGIDSHGVRLLPHYVKVIQGGRVNGNPDLRFEGRKAAADTLDADNAHGARATYAAMERAIELAGRCGVAVVGIRNSSHFGAAGAYAKAAADVGFIGAAFCNSDSFVRLHEGAQRFHGTNPIAVCAPVAGSEPWLLDMATSSVPFNRVELYRSLGEVLPPSAASDDAGTDVLDADLATMLAPLGGIFGFKGAGLAGLAEILSAVVTGMKLSPDIAPMVSDDNSTPRGLGAFVLALDPAAFIDRSAYDAGMNRYLHLLRNSAPKSGGRVLAPGDREWAVRKTRQEFGVPLDPETTRLFAEIAQTFAIESPLA